MKGKKLHIKPGDTFSRLTVISEVEKKNRKRYFLCVCECGKKKEFRLDGLTSGTVRSCGCLNREISSRINTQHGKCTTRLYRIWAGMKGRCYNKNKDCYHNYGGRGITVCQEWLDDFEVFQKWALQNGYKESLSIERVDVNGNYEPNNCTWVTMDSQKRNTTISKRITYEGQTKTMRQWAKVIGIHNSTLSNRLKKMSFEKAFKMGSSNAKV